MSPKGRCNFKASVCWHHNFDEDYNIGCEVGIDPPNNMIVLVKNLTLYFKLFSQGKMSPHYNKKEKKNCVTNSIVVFKYV